MLEYATTPFQTLGGAETDEWTGVQQLAEEELYQPPDAPHLWEFPGDSNQLGQLVEEPASDNSAKSCFERLIGKRIFGMVRSWKKDVGLIVSPEHFTGNVRTHSNYLLPNMQTPCAGDPVTFELCIDALGHIAAMNIVCCRTASTDLQPLQGSQLGQSPKPLEGLLVGHVSDVDEETGAGVNGVHINRTVADPKSIVVGDILAFSIDPEQDGQASYPVWKLAGWISKGQAVHDGEYIGQVRGIVAGYGANVHCPPVRAVWGREPVFSERDLAMCGVHEGDTIAFCVHGGEAGPLRVLGPCWLCCVPEAVKPGPVAPGLLRRGRSVRPPLPWTPTAEISAKAPHDKPGKPRSGNSIETLEITTKLFVGSLPRTATRESVRNYFSQFGTVTDVELKFGADGKSATFGYVMFASLDATRRVLANRENNRLEGKWIDCRAPVPRGSLGKLDASKEAQEANPTTHGRLLRVRGLPPATGFTHVVQVLGSFGLVKAWREVRADGEPSEEAIALLETKEQCEQALASRRSFKVESHTIRLVPAGADDSEGPPQDASDPRTLEQQCAETIPSPSLLQSAAADPAPAEASSGPLGAFSQNAPAMADYHPEPWVPPRLSEVPDIQSLDQDKGIPVSSVAGQNVPAPEATDLAPASASAHITNESSHGAERLPIAETAAKTSFDVLTASSETAQGDQTPTQPTVECKEPAKDVLEPSPVMANSTATSLPSRSDEDKEQIKRPITEAVESLAMSAAKTACRKSDLPETSTSELGDKGHTGEDLKKVSPVPESGVSKLPAAYESTASAAASTAAATAPSSTATAAAPDKTLQECNNSEDPQVVDICQPREQAVGSNQGGASAQSVDESRDQAAAKASNDKKLGGLFAAPYDDMLSHAVDEMIAKARTHCMDINPALAPGRPPGPGRPASSTPPTKSRTSASGEPIVASGGSVVPRAGDKTGTEQQESEPAKRTLPRSASAKTSGVAPKRTLPRPANLGKATTTRRLTVPKSRTMMPPPPPKAPPEGGEAPSAERTTPGTKRTSQSMLRKDFARHAWAASMRAAQELVRRRSLAPPPPPKRTQGDTPRGAGTKHRSSSSGWQRTRRGSSARRSRSRKSRGRSNARSRSRNREGSNSRSRRAHTHGNPRSRSRSRAAARATSGKEATERRPETPRAEVKEAPERSQHAPKREASKAEEKQGKAFHSGRTRAEGASSSAGGSRGRSNSRGEGSGAGRQHVATPPSTSTTSKGTRQGKSVEKAAEGGGGQLSFRERYRRLVGQHFRPPPPPPPIPADAASLRLRSRPRSRDRAHGRGRRMDEERGAGREREAPKDNEKDHGKASDLHAQKGIGLRESRNATRSPVATRSPPGGASRPHADHGTHRPRHRSRSRTRSRSRRARRPIDQASPRVAGKTARAAEASHPAHVDTDSLAVPGTTVARKSAPPRPPAATTNTTAATTSTAQPAATPPPAAARRPLPGSARSGAPVKQAEKPSKKNVSKAADDKAMAKGESAPSVPKAKSNASTPPAAKSAKRVKTRRPAAPPADRTSVKSKAQVLDDTASTDPYLSLSSVYAAGDFGDEQVATKRLGFGPAVSDPYLCMDNAEAPGAATASSRD